MAQREANEGANGMAPGSNAQRRSTAVDELSLSSGNFLCNTDSQIPLGKLFGNFKAGLGTYRELVVSSECTSHIQLIHKLFPNALAESWENFFEAVKSEGSFVVRLGVRLSEMTWRRSQVGDGLFLAASRGVASVWSSKTILNRNWIDVAKLRRWKSTCDTRHGSHKDGRYKLDSLSLVPPAFLVDTWNQCLAPAHPSTSYIALSYLWGPTTFFTSLKHTLESLQKLGALSEEGFLRIPRTIRDAMALVKLLGERYLWVDSLCIPQDDAQKKHDEIKNMATIYANASLTIIASQGQDVNFGLRGLKGISQSRNFCEKTFELNGSSQIVCHRQADIQLEDSLWMRRGWTFQEYLFSSRALVFVDDTVFWKCPHSFWEEPFDHDYDNPSGLMDTISEWNELLSAKTPHLPALGRMISAYNKRELTYPEDVLDGFAGPASVLTKNFPGGFLCGIPITFFDIFLLWRPKDGMKRRTPKNPHFQRLCLPSWSWIGWQGQLDEFSFDKGFDFAKDYPSFKDGVYVSDEHVVPIIQWSSHETRGSKGIPVASTCEEHWVGMVNAHEEFTDDGSSSAGEENNEEDEVVDDDQASGNNEDQEMSWGDDSTDDEAMSHKTECSCKDVLELVAISQGYAYNSVLSSEDTLLEWAHPERPKGTETYQFYNVLCIEWEDSIAYRRGIGRVFKDAWERQELEWIDLMLG
ncbi:hypothetical protein G7Y89_g10261 [Cudoniella acicularis]|uniref:Heterokaryon incompatibility domain-containing protein n=1 Tax=Cudoniella acicularis TaxID=354080 RepID=A0A8H4RFV6_9HELO|nr:hypothetical protein G7Y89_g10261 [Cudoniella acicularis]